MFTREEPIRSTKIKAPLIPILVVVLVILQFAIPNKGWVILLSGFGGVWLISLVWARTLKKGLVIHRDMSFGWKQVGDRILERISLENDSWMPSLWVNIDDHSDMQDYNISTVTGVGGWRNRNWYAEGRCSYRGLFTLGPVTLKTEDPFGIYEVTVDFQESVNMMVVPPVVPLPEIEIASGGRIGEGRSSNKGIKQTVSTVGIREYSPGDSLRWLHWPTIARTGNLYVRLFENEPVSDWWVLLDMDAEVQVGEGHTSTEEHGVMLAASLVNRGLQMGKHVGLITHGENLIWHPPEIGDSHLWAILRSLATIRSGGPPLEQMLARLRLSLGRNTSLIIITSNTSLVWIRPLEMLKRMGIIPTVLLLEPASFGADTSIDAVQDRLIKLGIRQHVIKSDLLDRPKRQEKRKWDWIMPTQFPIVTLNNREKFLKNIRRFIRTWGLIFMFFLVFNDLLEGTVRGVDSSLAWYMIFAAMVTGGILGLLKIRGWATGIISGVVGLLLTLLRVGNLWGKLLDLVVRLFQLLPEYYARTYEGGERIDYGPVLIRLNEITTGLTAIVIRFWDWTLSLVGSNPFYDPVIIAIVWGFAIFSVVIWSVWWVKQKNQPLTGFFPGLVLIATTVVIVGKTPYNLVFIVGVVVASMILIRYDFREHSWFTEKVGFSPSIRKNVLFAAAVLSLSLMVFSSIAPSISIQSITDYFRNLSGVSVEEDSEIARSFGFTRKPEGGEIDPLSLARSGGLPNQHLLQSSDELSDEIVMHVEVESPQKGLIEPPLYLRSLVYDKYIGSGWESRETDFIYYSAGEEMLYERPERSIPIRQHIQIMKDDPIYLYSTGIPNSVDRDFKVAWRVRDTQNKIFDIFGATVERKSYKVDSYVTEFTADELRTASQVYPEWIRTRYLGLPSNIPEEVLSLSLELTATGLTPYDRAVAIEQYLREIPYSLDVGVGPAGVDIVDYFLFRLKKGYCDHYASAMVVLARAAGIPARYVVGYIGENYNAEENVYVITADQSHAWVEVYFSGFGWVPFEPTGGRQAIDRLQEPVSEIPEVFEFDFNPLVPERSIRFDNWQTILGVILIIIVTLGFLVLRVADWMLARKEPHELLPKLYKRIYMYGQLARLNIKPGDTAYCFSENLISYMTQLSRESYWAQWMLDGRRMIRDLSRMFVVALFNPQQKGEDSAQILNLYKKLRYRLWLLVILGKAYPYRILRPFLWINTPLLIQEPLEEKS